MHELLYELSLQMITFIHIMYILFIILAPFSNVTFALVLHAIIIPFMVFHWLTNNNMCALTLLEKHIRRQKDANSNNDDCFTCKLIEPIYDFTNNKGSMNLFIYLITFGLWGTTLFVLYSKYETGEIKTFYELLK